MSTRHGPSGRSAAGDNEIEKLRQTLSAREEEFRRQQDNVASLVRRWEASFARAEMEKEDLRASLQDQADENCRLRDEVSALRSEIESAPSFASVVEQARRDARGSHDRLLHEINRVNAENAALRDTVSFLSRKADLVEQRPSETPAGRRGHVAGLRSALEPLLDWLMKPLTGKLP